MKVSRTKRKYLPRGFWTEESCRSIIQRESLTATDFSRKYPGGYDFAYRYGLLKSLPFVRNVAPHDYWTEEMIRSLVEKHPEWSPSDFQKSHSGAYYAARRFDIIDSLPLKRRKSRNWTDQSCLEKSREYRSRGEFKEGCPSCYTYARTHFLPDGRALIDTMYWLKRKPNPYSDNMDCVYAYFFDGLDRNHRRMHHVYVGRTVNLVATRCRHSKSENDTVLKFARRRRVPVPELTVIESVLPMEGPGSGVDREDFHVKRFEAEGWKVLNVGKTGMKSGAIGSLRRKWTLKSVNRLIDEKGYKFLWELKRDFPGAVSAAERGRFTDMLKVKKIVRPSEIFTKEYCRERARGCSTRLEFKTKDATAYKKSYEAGWLDEFDLPADDCLRPRRPVVQMSYEGKPLRGFPSMKEAARWISRHGGNPRVDSSCSCISAACRRGIAANGYLWRFADPARPYDDKYYHVD